MGKGRNDIFIILIIFLSTLIIKIPLILFRQFPTNVDEIIYLIKSLNYTHYLSYYAPDSMQTDVPSYYAPIYSLIISPANLIPSLDPTAQYQLVLFINAIITSSIALPAYKIAEHEFPSRRYISTSLVALWAVPFTWSFIAMSEALFIPLFMWLGYCYLVYKKKPSLKNGAVLSLVLSIMVLTRNVAIALIPAFCLIILLSIRDGGVKLAEPKVFLKRFAMLAPPLATYVIWKFLLERPASTGQTVGNYVGIGFRTIISIKSIFSYANAWLGQLAYLHFASGCIFIVLVLHLIFKYCKSERKSGPDADAANGLAPLTLFFIITSLFFIIPSTLHMLVGQAKIPQPFHFEKYLIFGRYIDMIIPVIALYGTGFMTNSNNKVVKRHLVFLLKGSVIVGTCLFLVALKGGSGYGIKWFYDTKEYLISTILLYFGCLAILMVVLLSYIKQRFQYILVVILLILQCLNVQAAFAYWQSREKHLFGVGDNSLIQDVKQIRAIMDETGGALFLAKGSNDSFMNRVAKYSFYGKTRYLEKNLPVDDNKDYILYKDRLYPAKQYKEILRDEEKKRR